MSHKEETPLRWADGWERTPLSARKSRGSRNKPLRYYRDALYKELTKIGVDT